MEVRKLTCPSCGAALGIPAGLDRAHCVYCGSDIIIEDTETRRRASDLANYLELGETAQEGGDTEEAEQWFNKALELNVKNEQAWIGKALAVQGSSTKVRNRFEESLRCLEKALEINPDSEAVKEAKREVISRECSWMVYLSDEEWELAGKICDIWREASAKSLNILGAFGLDGEAKRQAAPHVANAVNYLKRALELNPDGYVMLHYMVGYLEDWPQFGDPAPYKERLRLIELRVEAPTELPALREKLMGIRKELAQAEERGGLLRGLRIKRLRDQEQSLMKSIDVYEEALSKQRA